MEAEPSKKVLEILAWPAAIVAAFTAVSTPVAWVVASADTAGTVIQIAGLVYVGVWLAAVVRKIWGQQWRLRAKIGATIAACIVPAAILALSIPWDDRDEILLYLLGAVGLVVGLLLAIAEIGKAHVRRKKEELRRLGEEIELLRECVDCRETIRADAKVCHYCGFRYEPKPFIVPEVSADADAIPDPDVVASRTAS